MSSEHNEVMARAQEINKGYSDGVARCKANPLVDLASFLKTLPENASDGYRDGFIAAWRNKIGSSNTMYSSYGSDSSQATMRDLEES